MYTPPTPTLPSTFLAVQGVGTGMSRQPQLMHALHTIPALGAALASARMPAPSGPPFPTVATPPPPGMPAMKDGGLLVRRPVDVNRVSSPTPDGGRVTGFVTPHEGEYATFVPYVPPGAAANSSGNGAPPVDQQLVDLYIATYGLDKSNYVTDPEAHARAALANPATLAAMQAALAHQQQYPAGSTAIDVENIRVKQLYEDMKARTANEQANRDATAQQNAFTRADLRAKEDQVAAANHEQMILDWHKAQLLAEDSARTAAETAQRDQMSSFAALLPYGHQPGFDVGTYRQGQPTGEYTVTAPVWKAPSIQNTQIPQPNTPAIAWPTPPAGAP